MKQEETTEAYIRLLSDHQLRIQSMIYSVIHDKAAAADVFQETNLAMWRSFDRYDSSQPFGPWAMAIARNQVLQYFRKCKRDRLVFGDELLGYLVEDAERACDTFEQRREALKDCLAKLSQRNQDLYDRFYVGGQSSAEIAKAWQRSVHAVYKALKVMRRSLWDCVNQQVEVTS